MDKNVKKSVKNARNFKLNKTLIERLMVVGMLLLIVMPSLAQTNPGVGGIGQAATTIKSYWNPVKLLIQTIGGIVGLIGAVRIYNKWTNGDQDINKELVGWGGACLFLIIAPQFIDSFFSMT